MKHAEDHSHHSSPLALLQLSGDNMTATLQEINFDAERLSAEELIDDLLQQGVVYGLDETALQHVVIQYNKYHTLHEPVCVARGKEAIAARATLLQPHFQTALITVKAEGNERSIECSELMEEGRLIALLQPAHPGQEGKTVTGQTVAAEEALEIALTVGPHLELDEQTGRITATATGYPEALISSSKKETVCKIELHPAVTFDKDFMMAGLSLLPPLPGQPPLDHDDILALLGKHKVVFGIDTRAIDTLLLRLAANHPPEKEVIVARGILPVHGRDSHVRFVMDIGPIPGKLLANGQIDFRERQLFIGIGKGQLIATRVAATRGESGKNIRGEMVAPIPGKELPITISEDICFDEQSGAIHAGHSGVLSITGDNVIKVCAMQIIAGDVNFSTGNISSRDALQIQGSVKPLFKVVAAGDIGIEGGLEGASATSGANIVVKGGITGNQPRLQAGGDIDINFIEQGRAFAVGSIILRKEAYYSRLHANSAIHCHKSSSVLGGQLVAGGPITCGTVGSMHSRPTLVAAGVEPKRFQQHHDLQRTIAKLDAEITSLQTRGDQKNPGNKLKRLEKKLSQVRKEQENFDLTGVTTPDQDISITIHGTVYPGTEIRIGNHTMTVHTDAEAVSFFFSEEFGSIFVKSL